MVAEKGVAFAEAATTLASGGSINKVVRRVRSRVNKNKRRFRVPEPNGGCSNHVHSGKDTDWSRSMTT